MTKRALLCAVVLAACASPPELADPGTSGVWGYLRLVPREGAPVAPSGAGYGDRRVANAKRIDYSQPGFAVVFVEGPLPDPATHEVVIPPTDSGAAGGAPPALPGAAVGLGSEIRIENRSDHARPVSCPAAGLLTYVDPGASLTFVPAEAGLFEIFLLDESLTLARVFVSPGPFSVVSPAGRYALVGLAPGPHRLRGWHPRFPPSTQDIALAADEVARVDVELGVGTGTRPPEARAGDGIEDPPASHAH